LSFSFKEWTGAEDIPYQFPVADVTNDHKHSGLKQPTLIISQFWGSEFQHGSHWANIKGSSEVEPVSLPFLAPKKLLHSLIHGPFSPSVSQQHNSFTTFSLNLLPLPHLFL
jgi:hypothetical protein